MNLINIENLTKVYTERKLFDGASFRCRMGRKSVSLASMEPERQHFYG